jgi:hypothetical protein
MGGSSAVTVQVIGLRAFEVVPKFGVSEALAVERRCTYLQSDKPRNSPILKVCLMAHSVSSIGGAMGWHLQALRPRTPIYHRNSMLA